MRHVSLYLRIDVQPLQEQWQLRREQVGPFACRTPGVTCSIHLGGLREVLPVLCVRSYGDERITRAS